jgi:hypothetical protein
MSVFVAEEGVTDHLALSPLTPKVFAFFLHVLFLLHPTSKTLGVSMVLNRSTAIGERENEEKKR